MSSKIQFDVDSNYFELCSKTLRCYEELVMKMNDQKISSLMSGEVLVIFGKTRAGKSTLLLRFSTELSNDQFIQHMVETKAHIGRIFTVNGIEVASGNQSVTMVPNFYNLNGKLVIDLAGFDDLTQTRRPIISLLNHHLLSQIPNAKLLTIVSMESFLSNSLDTTMRSFYQNYVDLLGLERVRQGLQSTLFMITRCDLYSQTLLNDIHGEDLEDLLYLEEKKITRKSKINLNEDKSDTDTKSLSFNNVLNHTFDLSINKYSTDLASHGDTQISDVSSAIGSRRVIVNYKMKKDEILDEMDWGFIHSP